MSELRKDLGIDDWLELVKEDKNLNGAYISFGQYMYILEQELTKYKERNEKLLEKINFYETTEWGLRSCEILKLFKEILEDKENINE